MLLFGKMVLNFVFAFFVGGTSIVTPLPLDKTPENFTLPAGFSMTVFAKDLGKPRTLMIGPAGKLIVALFDDGKIVELNDADGNGEADGVVTLVEGLDKPHGLEQKCENGVCEVFIAEKTRVSSYIYKTNPDKLEFKEKLVDLPEGGRHITRSLLFLPYPEENKLLISIGSSCDTCGEENSLYGTVQVLDVKTKEMKPYATGLRNAVYMTLNPVSGKPWVTEMGRDFLGVDLPPDELNVLEKEGGFYGWPICYGKNIHDTVFDQNDYFRNPCMEPLEIPSKIDIPAHSAPLGLAFIPEEGWPESYWHDLIVAYHGSLNRDKPEGYKVVRFDFDAQGNLLGVSDFLTGFMSNKKELFGRPAGVLALPGGVIYLTDDEAGKIYQINYRNK